jgi:hypothetical protein
VASRDRIAVPDGERLVIVEWTDSASSATWSDKRELEPSVCVSVGWLLADGDDAITVAASYTNTGAWGDHTAIPRSVVRRIVDLRQDRRTG